LRACRAQEYEDAELAGVPKVVAQVSGDKMREVRIADHRIEVDTGTSEVLCEIRSRVALITLNRPEARNAFSERLAPALWRVIKQYGDDRRVGALLITGADSAFCAGEDVKGMDGNSTKAELPIEKHVAELRMKQRALTGALVAVRKPTIAALPGPAAGAGLALALACDIRIASESAIMATAYARIGLTGDYGIAWLLTRLAGTSRARELMFLSERIDARRCESLGLVNRVVPDATLRETAFAFAKSLAEGPSVAFAWMKDNLDHALTSDILESMDQEAENIIQAAQTTDHKEAVRAFIDKRQPVFGGH
jgi:enoyl-CoA hydratase/carnithine racemase